MSGDSIPNGLVLSDSIDSMSSDTQGHEKTTATDQSPTTYFG